MTDDATRETRENEPPVCARCGEEYSMDYGMEPTKYCDPCAHERVAELEALDAGRNQASEKISLSEAVYRTGGLSGPSQHALGVRLGHIKDEEYPEPKMTTDELEAATRSAVAPPDEHLVIELARELYDRFVMGGWQPEDAYPQIRAMLAGPSLARRQRKERNEPRMD